VAALWTPLHHHNNRLCKPTEREHISSWGPTPARVVARAGTGAVVPLIATSPAARMWVLPCAQPCRHRC